MKRILFSIAAASQLILLAQTHALTIHVTTSGDDANDGATWASAFRTIQHAIATATTGDEVWIAAGTYHPNDADPSNLDRNQSFALKNGVSVIGGFTGSETLAEDRDPVAHPVILSGDLNRDDADGDGDGLMDTNVEENALHVIKNSAALALDTSARLGSVTVRGGRSIQYASPPSVTVRGGAIWNEMVSPSYFDCHFTDNEAFAGGAVFNEGSNSQFSGCTFSRNYATNGGGAVFCLNSSPGFKNCTLSQNKAKTGGAFGCKSSTPAISHCTIDGNIAEMGPAILNESGSAYTTVINSILWGPGPAQISGSFIRYTNCLVRRDTDTDWRWSGPKLLPLGYYGGRTPTQPPSYGSSAINAGQLEEAEQFDQRGIERDETPDIGACENLAFSPELSISTPESVPHFALGYSPILQLFSESQPDSIQWFHGESGEMSLPIAGAVEPTLTHPPLIGTTKVWVRIMLENTPVDSATFTITTAPATYFVATTGSDSNDGLSWSTPWRTLNASLTADLSFGAEIWIAAGTYFPNDNNPSNRDRFQTFQLINGVSIIGGFAGNESNLEERNLAANEVVFSGDLRRNDVDGNGDGKIDPPSMGDNAYHLFYHPADLFLDETAILDSVTIRAGRADGTSPHNRGGAVLNLGASSTFRNCKFTEGFGAHSSGGMMNWEWSYPTILNCVFENNTAIFGAAIDNHMARVTIQSCTFSGNQCTNGGIGGAISNYSLSNCKIDSCTFFNNSANNGGAIYNYGTIYLKNCTFTANSGFYASAFSNESFSELTNCTFSDNAAGSNGYSVSHLGTQSYKVTRLTNCIVWGESDLQIGGQAVVKQCVVKGGITGDGNLADDPLLLPLGDYGGPTLTMPPGPGSSAFNAGAEIDPGGLDQRGLARLAVGALDIGAVEIQEEDAQPYIAALWETDRDGDGYPWGVENALGTNPNVADPAHASRLTASVVAPGDSPVLEFGLNPDAVAGTRWILRRSTDLMDFDEIYRYDGISETLAEDVLSGIAEGFFTITDGTGGDRAFYQFEAVYEP